MSKQRLARWVVKAIEVAFSSAGVPSPEGVVAHYTRGMAASWALFKFVPLELVCAAAGWISSLTFSRFYRLNAAASLAASREGISL